ncbi:YraN family protein [Alkaliphilus sp. B6464]|nr:YraN family protein [Alkaliphilus sp. B6464]
MMKIKLGLIGEQLAVNYIRDNGYYILDRNYRTRLGELDIIAKKDNIIAFIEVKTRTSNTYGMPSEAVNYRKQKTIQRLSQQYILHKKLNNTCCHYRFDVIEVKIIGKKYKIDHIENAF